jgi:hypothetical protein
VRAQWRGLPWVLRPAHEWRRLRGAGQGPSGNQTSSDFLCGWRKGHSTWWRVGGVLCTEQARGTALGSKISLEPRGLTGAAVPPGEPWLGHDLGLGALSNPRCPEALTQGCILGKCE